MRASERAMMAVAEGRQARSERATADCVQELLLVAKNAAREAENAFDQLRDELNDLADQDEWRDVAEEGRMAADKLREASSRCSDALAYAKKGHVHLQRIVERRQITLSSPTQLEDPPG